MKVRIWENWLKAELRARYWDCMAKRYYRYDLFIKLFMAVAASSTVASWKMWAENPEVWKVLSCISAVVSIANPFFKFTDRIKKMSSLSKEWSHIKDDYEVLWVKRNGLTPPQVITEFSAMKRKEKAVDDSDAILPGEDKRLLNLCQDYVECSRGLKGGKHG